MGNCVSADFEKVNMVKQYIKNNFSWEGMKQLVNKKLEENVPDMPVNTSLNLSNLGLPKLNKI